MADEIEQTPLGVASSKQVPNNVGRFALDPLNHAIAAGSRHALKQGVPTHQVIEMLLNALCSVVAMIDPAPAREMLIKDVVGSIPKLTGEHVTARFSSPGGIVHPKAGVPS